MERPPDSRSQPSLDEIVSQSAVVIAQQIQSAAGWAKSEMDLQVEVAGILKDFARRAKINPLEGHHNITTSPSPPDAPIPSMAASLWNTRSPAIYRPTRTRPTT